MRILSGLVAMLCMVGLLLSAGVARAQEDAGPMPVESVALETTTGGALIAAEIARTPADRERGLMFRHRLPPDRGMLFIYEQPQVLSMWMRNTYVPLDMVFLDTGGRVVSIAKDTVPLSEVIVSSSGPALAVLELLAGTAERIGLQVGDRALHPAFGPVE
jgi:uncharacterized membrane protein (UPF0127 family)